MNGLTMSIKIYDCTSEQKCLAVSVGHATGAFPDWLVAEGHDAPRQGPYQATSRILVVLGRLDRTLQLKPKTLSLHH